MGRAVVIGSGVAGTVAALALQQAGWEPVIHEAYEHSAGLEQGVFLTVAVNGLDALAAVGASDIVGQLGFPTGNITFASGSGKSLGAMPIGPTTPQGATTRTLRRRELYAALYELCTQRGIPVVHGARFVSAQRSAAGVVAEFADGSTATGDVLVGADGIRSTVRSVIDPRAPEPRYTGMGNVGGFSAVDGLVPDGGDYRMIWGRRCFFGYTVSPDGEVWWFANPPAREPLSAAEVAAIGRDEVISRVRDLVAADRGPAADIVAASQGEVLLGNQWDMPRVPRWHRDGMVVIGDAAHAASPATGQGVSLACEDAVVLAQCLRDVPDVDAALTRYEQLRRARIDRVVKWGSRMGGTKTTGPLLTGVRDLVLPWILARGSTPKAMARQAWLFDHHVEWDAPVEAR